MSIRQDVLDGRLLDKFNGALTPEMIDYLVTATNQVLPQLRGATPQEIETLTAERQVVERELSNLVEFVIKGVLSSSRLREEIRAREQWLAELDRGLEQLRAAALPAPRRINREWIEDQLQTLRKLVARDSVGARREIQKHIDDLRSRQGRPV